MTQHWLEALGVAPAEAQQLLGEFQQLEGGGLR